jgi:DNA-binding transcriptional LysR family regulator
VCCILQETHPALTKSLARLEGAMQVKLFNRGGKGMELTAEGSLLLLSRARELRQSLWNVAREVSDVNRLSRARKASETMAMLLTKCWLRLGCPCQRMKYCKQFNASGFG